jgi:hypothetical protein
VPLCVWMKGSASLSAAMSVAVHLPVARAVDGRTAGASLGARGACKLGEKYVIVWSLL